MGAGHQPPQTPSLKYNHFRLSADQTVANYRGAGPELSAAINEIDVETLFLIACRGQSNGLLSAESVEVDGATNAEEW